MIDSRTTRRIAGALAVQPRQITQIRAKVQELMALMKEAGMGLPEMVTTFRLEAVILTMLKMDGNQCRAARELKIHRNTLSRIIEDWMERRARTDHVRR